MKTNNKNKFSKASIQSMLRMAQISEFGFNEIFPKILMREAENIKKIKKKKQNNIKLSNSKQINKKSKKGIQK